MTNTNETRRLIKYVLPISLEAGEQIIDSVIESDLLGLVARMMTLLKPVVGGMESSELSNTCPTILSTCCVLIAET